MLQAVFYNWSMEAVINVVVLKYTFFVVVQVCTCVVFLSLFWFFKMFLNPWLPSDVCPKKILNEIQCCLQLLLVQFFSFSISLRFDLPKCFYF